MKTTKRVLSILLTLVMLVTAVPVYAFAMQENQNVEQNTTAEIKQTNSFSKMLAEEMDLSQIDPSVPYYVSDIVFNGQNADVSYYNAGDCLLAVGVYDENTEQMIAVETKDVGAESLETSVSFKEALPEHFVAKAFLLGEDNNGLCKACTVRRYTTEYVLLSEKTVDDFDTDKVIILDEREQESFAVLSENAKIISGGNAVNILSQSDVQNNTYTLTNIDDTVKALHSGDIIYLDNGSRDELLCVKIKSISINGSQAVLIAEDTELEDVFEFIKIDADATAGQCSYSDQGADESVEYEGEVDYETGEPLVRTRSADVDLNASISHKFKLKNKEVKNKSGKVTAEFSGGLTFSAKIGFSAYISKEFKEVTFTLDPSVKVEVKATGEIEALTLSLGSFGVCPVAGVYIGIEPKFTVKISGEFSLSQEIKFTLGVGYNSRDGFCNKCKKPSVTFEIKAEVTVYIGFDLQPHVALVSTKFLKLTLSGEIGAKAVAKMREYTALGSDEDSHDCAFCIDGDLKGIFEISVKLVFGEDTWVETELKAKLISIDWKIGNFYYSLTYHEFGFGCCPHSMKSYTVTVKSIDEKRVKNADITVKSSDGGTVYSTATTDKNGVASVKSPNGKVRFNIAKSQYKTTVRTATVTEDTKNLNFTIVPIGISLSDGTGSRDSVFTGTETTGTIINFGSYPQSKVTDPDLIKKLEMQSKIWESYEYYTGSGNWSDGKMEPSDYMNYADFKYDGEKYRAVTFSKYRPYHTGYTSSSSSTNQDENGYYVDNVYYFKYEPLKWRVLDAGEGLVLSEYAIDSQAYNNYVLYANSEYWGDEGLSHYASDYANSSIHDWLNDEFYNTAFSAVQQDRIESTNLENKSRYNSKYDSADTDDNIFLLSWWDVQNSAYGFSTSYSAYDVNRRAHSTDYAKCQGCYTYKNSSYQTASGEDTSYWWLRSPCNSDYASRVGSNGYASNYDACVDSAYIGVRPALKLTQSSNPKSPAPGKKVPAKAGTAGEIKTLYTTCGACAAGADYMLLNVTGYGEDFTLTSGNLLYIDQLTADGSGNLNVRFTPKYNDPDSTTLLIGDFGSGVETKILQTSEVKKYTLTWVIDGKQTVEYLAQGDPITPPAVPEKAGYTFKGWEPMLSRSMPGHDVTYTAVYEKNPEPQGRVQSVKIDDLSLNYKKSTTLKPQITADPGVTYTVKYESSNAKIATVDQNGSVYAAKRGSGSATVTCTVTDQYGNTVKDTCTVNVSLSFGQKIIVYVLFGWIWY